LTKNGDNKLINVSDTDEMTFYDIEHAFSILLLAQERNIISVVNYCASWIVKQKYKILGVNNLQFENANIRCSQSWNDCKIDTSKIDMEAVRKMNVPSYTANMILLTYDTLTDFMLAIMSNVASNVNSMRWAYSAEVIKELISSPYLIVDSENTVLQLINYGCLDDTQLLSLVKFDQLSINYLKTVVLANFKEPMQKMIIDAIVLHRTGKSIPRITMKDVTYKAKMMFPIDPKSGAKELFIAEGYRFNIIGHSDYTFRLECLACGIRTTAYENFYVNAKLTVQLKTKVDKAGFNVNKSDNNCIFTDKVSAIVIDLISIPLNQAFCDEHDIIVQDDKMIMSLELTINHEKN